MNTNSLMPNSRVLLICLLIASAASLAQGELKTWDGRLVLEGNYNRGQHFPGAASGGARARATYLAHRRTGYGAKMRVTIVRTACFTSSSA